MANSLGTKRKTSQSPAPHLLPCAVFLQTSSHHQLRSRFFLTFCTNSQTENYNFPLNRAKVSTNDQLSSKTPSRIQFWWIHSSRLQNEAAVFALAPSLVWQQVGEQKEPSFRTATIPKYPTDWARTRTLESERDLNPEPAGSRLHTWALLWEAWSVQLNVCFHHTGGSPRDICLCLLFILLPLLLTKVYFKTE